MTRIFDLGDGGQTAGVNIVDLVDAIATWCQCLQGQRTIRSGLEAIAQGFGADAVSLVKAGPQGAGGVKAITVQPYLRGAELDRGLSDLILGGYLPKARVGSVWFGSMAAEDSYGVLNSIRRQTGLAETVVIVLNHEAKWVHLLEISFAHRLDAGKAAMLNSLAATLAETWTHRAPGLFSEALLERRPARENLAFAAPILSDDNPARLSRAEFRVCLLLSNGLSKDAVREELKITASTLRSHLRQICAKTECASVNELTHRLLVSTQRPGLAAQRAVADAARRSA